MDRRPIPRRGRAGCSPRCWLDPLDVHVRARLPALSGHDGAHHLDIDPVANAERCAPTDARLRARMIEIAVAGVGAESLRPTHGHELTAAVRAPARFGLPATIHSHPAPPRSVAKRIHRVVGRGQGRRRVREPHEPAGSLVTLASRRAGGEGGRDSGQAATRRRYDHPWRAWGHWRRH